MALALQMPVNQGEHVHTRIHTVTHTHAHTLVINGGSRVWVGRRCEYSIFRAASLTGTKNAQLTGTQFRHFVVQIVYTQNGEKPYTTTKYYYYDNYYSSYYAATTSNKNNNNNKKSSSKAAAAAASASAAAFVYPECKPIEINLHNILDDS